MPDPARTVPLWDFAQPAPAGRIAAPMPLRWPDMPVGSLLDFTLDASATLAGASDVLSIYLADPGALTLVSESVSGGLATLWLTGGEAGTDNTIHLTLTTQSGRVIDRIVRLRTV